MTTDYREYGPLVLHKATIDLLKSPEYERFIHSATTEPGLRLVLQRHQAKPDWPYVDTKFNPNAGQDLPPESYDVIYAWFLGRGTEALVEHLPVLDSLTGLSGEARSQVRDLLNRLIANMSDAIVRIMSANQGRCVFRVNREFKAVDEKGNTYAPDLTLRSGADTFCAKGLVAEGSAENIARGVRMLLEGASFIRRSAYGSDQGVDLAGKIGQGPKMLVQDAAGLVCRKTTDAKMRADILDMVAEFMQFVLDRHYDPETAVFAEYLDAATGERMTYLDPGHANEFVGLGLAAVAAMEAEESWLNKDRRELLARAKRELPRLLLKSCETGWNHTHHGLHKAVDTATGEVINDDMPWWNLPETMRSAVRALAVATDAGTREQLLEWFRLAHNAYFEHYLNRDKMLFPYQTRSGVTGRVVDKVPAVPEGDPLYHTNLSLLDMLAVIRTLK